jgi:hypothetical protein
MKNWLKKLFGRRLEARKAPVMVIGTDSNEIREYESIELAISELEKDPNVQEEKIQKLRTSIDRLRAKGVVKIQNGEII